MAGRKFINYRLIRFVWLAPILLLVQCDNGHYIKNKLKIISFSISHVVDRSDQIQIDFEIDYYTDSTNTNSYESAIEKGQDGSESEIIFMGCTYQHNDTIVHCSDLTINEFVKGFNNKERDFNGERLEKPQIFCFPKGLNLSEFIIVFKHTKTLEIDTLFVNSI